MTEVSVEQRYCHEIHMVMTQWILDYIADMLFQLKLQEKSAEEIAPFALIFESKFQKYANADLLYILA
jgi:hypothetical protein